VDSFDCEANAKWCSTGGFAKSEAVARQQIHDSKLSGAKLLGRIKLACFFSLMLHVLGQKPQLHKGVDLGQLTVAGQSKILSGWCRLRELFHIALAPFYIITMQTISTAACVFS
jgi:hypothetical protein